MNTIDASGAIEIDLRYDLNDEYFEWADAFFEEEARGERFAWLPYEVSEIGFEWLLGVDREPVEWLLEHGIAPNQPFRVRIHRPTYTGPDREGDYDVICNGHEIVWVEPWPCERVIAAWVEWLEGPPENRFVEVGERVRVYELAASTRS